MCPIESVVIQGRFPIRKEAADVDTEEPWPVRPSKLRYPSDLPEEKWALVKPPIPPAKRGGNRCHLDECEIVNGLMYILSTGCQSASTRFCSSSMPTAATKARHSKLRHGAFSLTSK
jgi:hypothetical protein